MSWFSCVWLWSWILQEESSPGAGLGTPGLGESTEIWISFVTGLSEQGFLSILWASIQQIYFWIIWKNFQTKAGSQTCTLKFRKLPCELQHSDIWPSPGIQDKLCCNASNSDLLTETCTLTAGETGGVIMKRASQREKYASESKRHSARCHVVYIRLDTVLRVLITYLSESTTR